MERMAYAALFGLFSIFGLLFILLGLIGGERIDGTTGLAMLALAGVFELKYDRSKEGR